MLSCCHAVCEALIVPLLSGLTCRWLWHSCCTQPVFNVSTESQCARIRALVNFDFERNATTYVVNLTACDNGTRVLCSWSTLSITIVDVNEAPVRVH